MESNGTLRRRTLEELFTASRFSLVGIAATGIHIGLVWTLIAQFMASPFIANLTAFLFAFVFSFTGQYLWTFRSTRHWPSALTRFFSISFGAFVVNNFVLIGLLRLELIDSSLAAALAACVIPLFTYLFGRFWAFR